MAYTTAQLAAERQTSIHGRRLALDRLDYIVGPRGLREPVTDLTTVGTTLNNGGIYRITATSTGPVTHNMPVPRIGARLMIFNQSTSTASHQFLSTPNGGAFIISSLGTTGNVLNNVGPAGTISLRAVSTVNWVVESIGPLTSTALASPWTWTTST